MKSKLILTGLTLLLPLLGFAADEGVPRSIHDDGPIHGTQPLDLHELWRVGGEDEDVIFGRIVDVIMHQNGEFYVLDNQICQVTVISADGEYLRDLSRQGDGPGEVRQPIGLAFLEDDVLGIGAGFPGKMVSMQLDGTPIDTHFPIGEPSDGNIGVMISIHSAAGILATTGGRLVFSPDGESHTERFVSVAEPGLGSYRRILERNTPIDPTGRRFIDAEQYYFDARWCLGMDGNFYVPMERDAYEISVFDRSGKLLRVFGRQAEPRKRTQDDKDQIRPMINTGRRPEDGEWDICDHDEYVTRILYNPDEQNIWVLTPHGSTDQPDGILETWDVFSPEGEYLKQVPIPLGDQMIDGACYLVGGGRLIVVRGSASSFNADGDDDQEVEETEVEPQEVICYEIR